MNETTEDANAMHSSGVDLTADDGANEMQQTCENLLRPNKKINLTDFELIKVVGRGSFGKVYLVKRNGTENYYAMKKLKKEVVAKRNLFIKTQGKSIMISDWEIYLFWPVCNEYS